MSLSATTRNNCCICSWDRAPLASGVKSSFGFSGLGCSAVVVPGEGEALSTGYPAGAAVDSGLCVAEDSCGAGLPSRLRRFPLKYKTWLACAEYIDPIRDRLVESQDRKSTRLNSSHVAISYAVFC